LIKLLPALPLDSSSQKAFTQKPIEVEETELRQSGLVWENGFYALLLSFIFPPLLLFSKEMISNLDS
jgi:hypothetical protein